MKCFDQMAKLESHTHTHIQYNMHFYFVCTHRMMSLKKTPEDIV